ncbi:MAG: hypothetical protein V1898_01790 [Patescibacteria group bacterium]
MVKSIFSTVRKLMQDKIFLGFFISGFFINVIIWALLIWQNMPSAESVFLHYNIYFGIDKTGLYNQLFYLPLFGLIVFFINSVISAIIYSKEKMFCFYLLAGSILTELIILTAVSLILYLNA